LLIKTSAKCTANKKALPVMAGLSSACSAVNMALIQRRKNNNKGTVFMQSIPTNDVFHHLINLLRLAQDKALIIEMFEEQNIEISNSKIKSWSTKSGGIKAGYREMPRSALDAFIAELYIRKLVVNDG